MSQEVLEWVNLFGRWVHVIAGIMWLGSTWLFQWMERAMDPPRDASDKNLSGELWMVHGGGFYFLQKQKWPVLMPHTLHWFRWEAMTTWLTGMLLMAVVYWLGAPLMEYGSDLPRWAGVGISIGSLVLGWAGYNLVWRSPLGKSEPLGAAVCWALVVALAWGLGRFLSDRAVYLHVGAIFGTIMVANVWMVIIPNQRKMIAITQAGGQPRPELGLQAKRCSKHNTYMAIPLLFTMISNHFPATTFGRDYGWALLGLLILVGFAGARIIRDHL